MKKIIIAVLSVFLFILFIAGCFVMYKMYKFHKEVTNYIFYENFEGESGPGAAGAEGQSSDTITFEGKRNQLTYFFRENDRKVKDLISDGKYEEALKEAESAIESAEEFESLYGNGEYHFINIYNNIAKALRKLGHYDEALETYKKITELEKYENVYLRLTVAETLCEAGRYEESLQELDSCINAAKESVNANANDRLSLIAMKKTLEAAYISKGDVLQQMGRYQDAIKEYDNSISIEMEREYKEYMAYMGKAKAFEAMGKLDESVKAMDAFVAAAKDKEAKSSAHSWKATYLYRAGKYKEAIDEYDKAISSTEQKVHGGIFVWKAKALFKIGQTKEAYKVLDEANLNDIYANNKAAYITKAEIAKEVGEIDSETENAYALFIEFAEKKEFKKAYIALNQFIAYSRLENKPVNIRQTDYDKWLSVSENYGKDFFVKAINSCMPRQE